jgi:hypothetical protein
MDVGAIDTGAFIKSHMKLGVDRMFQLADAVVPGEVVPPFACPGLLDDTMVIFTSGELAGQPALILFYPGDFGPEGEACLDLLADREVVPELGLQLVLREGRVRGPAVMLADRTGQVARVFGVLLYTAFPNLFLVDEVSGTSFEVLGVRVKVSGRGDLERGGLCPGGAAVMQLVREALGQVQGREAQGQDVQGRESMA